MSRTGHFSARIAVLLTGSGLLVFNLTDRAAAAVISNYGFDGKPANTAVDAPVAGATFSAFTRTNLNDGNHPNDFDSNGFTTSSSIDTTQYEGFSVTASGATPLTFEGIGWDTNRSGEGPEIGAIRYLIDNVLKASFIYAIPTANTPGHLWNFADFVLNPGQTVEFRFFGYNADSSEAFLRLDNVGFKNAPGPVVPSVPEPNSLILASMGAILALCCVYITRRRSQLAM
jgi:hypothetical protein